MRKMSNAPSEREARRMHADQEELADRIARALPRDGAVEPQPGLHFRRHSRLAERVYGFYAGCDRAGARDYAAFLGFFFLEPS
jgi:hypothetical protein